MEYYLTARSMSYNIFWGASYDIVWDALVKKGYRPFKYKAMLSSILLVVQGTLGDIKKVPNGDLS